MDVRCEKCQTEYELDEARLKPGGVTVKCTNCGHMFKIRGRTPTNVGAPAAPPGPDASRARTVSVKPPDASAAPGPVPTGGPPPGRPGRPDSIFDDVGRGPDEAPTAVDRQWLLRLENGEQKSCRELATLQQWIIAGVVTRESLISRTGKTWKRLGDIADLGQYFTIADEARASRERARQPPPRPPIKEMAGTGTLPGYGAQVAGGTIVPDDDDLGEAPTTRAPKRLRGTTPPPIPPAPPRAALRPPPAAATAPTEPAQPAPQILGRRPVTTPPPPPPRRAGVKTPQPPALPPASNRSTAMWATDGVKPEAPPDASAAGPRGGRVSAIPDEPAFAGRVRMMPGDEATFDTAKVRALDDDDDLLRVRRGSRAGMLVLVMALLAMGATAAVVYVFVFRGKGEVVATPPQTGSGSAGSGSAVAVGSAGSAGSAVAVPDAALAPPSLTAEHSELASDIEPRLRTAARGLEGKADAPSHAMRAHLIAQLAQDLLDRASVTDDKAAADALRKEARQLVLDAASAAQRALMAAGDDTGANIAMAEVLRLQGKPARDIKRYLDTARAKPDKDWARDLALADAMVLVRDSKLDEAKAAFAAIDTGDGKLESSGDVRARLHRALVLTAQDQATEARSLVDAILAAAPDHALAKALAMHLETQVAKSDPLPPEDGSKEPKEAPPPRTPVKPPVKEPAPGTARPPTTPVTPVAPPPAPVASGGGSYEQLLARANALAETNCGKAMELYGKALEQKPNGVEALTGMGYCHIDAKQFASAFSKFRAALAVSPRYEAALRGIAEAYTQQGRKEQAIEAYKAYLEAYPDSVAAKKQLERLGGDASGTSAPAPPPPAPPPSSDSSGAGSGSG